MPEAKKFMVELVKIQDVFENEKTGEIIEYHNYNIALQYNGKEILYKVTPSKDVKSMLDTHDIRTVNQKGQAVK